MKIGDVLVTAQQQRPPDQRANATQHHSELVNGAN
jgi:hypothetical protein